MAAIGRIRLAVQSRPADSSDLLISFLLQEASQKGWVRREIKLHILAATPGWMPVRRSAPCPNWSERRCGLVSPGGSCPHLC